MPELPSCTADGPSYQEAIKTVQDVIDGWIETATEMGWTIPEPKGRRLMLA